MSHSTIHIDEDVVNKVSPIFDKLGLSLEEAIHLFLSQTIIKQGLPLNIVIPKGASKESIERAMHELQSKDQKD